MGNLVYSILICTNNDNLKELLFNVCVRWNCKFAHSMHICQGNGGT